MWIEINPSMFMYIYTWIFTYMCLKVQPASCFLQFTAFIMLQVIEGKGRLRPGVDANGIIKDMFNNQDLNKDGKILEEELKLQGDDESERDELWSGCTWRSFRPVATEV